MSGPQGRGRGAAGDRGGYRGRGRGQGGPQPRGAPPGRGGRGFDSGGRGRGASSGPQGGFRGGRPVGDIIFSSQTTAHVDSRVSTSDDLVAAFKKLSITPERPHRPAFGTLGREITLRANFFAVKLPKGIFYDYRVEISPQMDIKRLKARIFWLLENSEEPGWTEFTPFIAHDGSERLISARKLPQPLDIPVPFYEDGQDGPTDDARVYTVSISLSNELDTSQLVKYLDGNINSRDYDAAPLISAVNLVLQQHAARSSTRVGKNRYFSPALNSPDRRFSLGNGLEAWKGFFISARPVYKELMVNVNVCMSAFYEPGNLADAIMAFNRNSRGATPQKFTQGIRVTTSHLGYKMKKPLKKIMGTTARTTKFDCQELGGQVSVEEYFKKKYKITLRYPNDLPVVDIGGAKRSNYLPAELCEIEPGLPYRGKLGDKETAKMIKVACNPPAVNADAIVNEGLPILALTPDTLTDPITGFDLTISNDMAVIPARELPPPRLSYRSGRPNVRDGSWNILDVTFHRGGVISSWWILVVRDGQEAFKGPGDPELTNLWRGFGEKCRKSGMQLTSQPMLISTPPLISINQDASRIRAIDQIRQTITGKLSPEHRPPTFILVLLSGRDNYIYPAIKRICDVELGIHTIHMLTHKVLTDSKKQDQYFSNVALKLNTKIGGINHLLDPDNMKWLVKKKTMIVGMDVTHPGPSSLFGTPSIAAVVASVDDSFVQFPASLRIQETRKEMITDLVSMMIERLTAYKEKNNAFPERVFVFRDGVSEGQFDTVIQEELPKMLDSFKRVKSTTGPKSTPYRPQLTIIICGKRHHARFFPTDSANADKNGNTRAGTVVDKGVTAVFDFDFYLQAHAGLQGTVKPTHYTVIYDENRLGADELQQGTHTSSYLYARATKAVSLVPAAYYADLACERGRCYLNDFLNHDDKTSTVGSLAKGKARGKAAEDEEKKRVFEAAERVWGNGVHPNLRGSMFYI